MHTRVYNPHTHMKLILPHKHKEKASGGHQSPPTGWRQHAQHGHNLNTYTHIPWVSRIPWVGRWYLCTKWIGSHSQITMRIMQKSWIPEPSNELRIMGYWGGRNTSPWTFFQPDSSMVSSWDRVRGGLANTSAISRQCHRSTRTEDLLTMSSSLL